MKNTIAAAIALLSMSSAMALADTFSGVPNDFLNGGGCFYFTIEGNDTTFIVPRSDDVLAKTSATLGFNDEVMTVEHAFYDHRSVTFNTYVIASCRGGDAHPVAQSMSPTRLP